MLALARRADALSLGHYTLAEFNAFYVALIMVCAAHDHLCIRWAHTHGLYPLESAVMARTVRDWTEVPRGPQRRRGREVPSDDR